MTLVSIVIPTYNGDRWIETALISVLAQTHRELQVIVIDDGSSDNTISRVTNVADPRIELHAQSNAGVAAARNAGIEHARGSIVAFLDQDDEWLPEKLEKQLPFFDDPGIGVVGSLMRYANEYGPVDLVAGEIADKRQEDIRAARLMPFPPSSMVIRRQLLLEEKGFASELARTIAPIDDLDLLSRLGQRTQIMTVPEVLGHYRVHTSAGSFERFFEMQQGTRYLQALRASEAIGLNLEWHEWNAQQPPSMILRLYDRAKFHYRVAGNLLIARKRIAGALHLLIALLLAPRYTTNRLLRQSGHRFMIPAILQRFKAASTGSSGSSPDLS